MNGINCHQKPNKMKHIYTLLIIASIALFSQNMHAQSIEESAEELHQIYLEKTAKSINHIEYDKTGEPIEGELSKDGKKVYLKNYEGKKRVKLNITYTDGKDEEFSKSPCFIDPVAPL